MRLFIEIQLNEEMRHLAGDIQDDYRRMAVRGNYTPPENLHLTLAFIGEYDDPQQVLDALENVSYKPFRITMDRTGCFDDLYWIGIEDGSRSIKRGSRRTSRSCGGLHSRAAERLRL